MREIEFRVPPRCDLARADGVVEEVCAKCGLEIAKKGRQASHPGCTHWHFRKPRVKGTLEITVFAPERRVWAQVKDGRRASWIDEELPVIQRSIERELGRLR